MLNKSDWTTLADFLGASGLTPANEVLTQPRDRDVWYLEFHRADGQLLKAPVWSDAELMLACLLKLTEQRIDFELIAYETVEDKYLYRLTLIDSETPKRYGPRADTAPDAVFAACIEQQSRGKTVNQERNDG